MKLSTKNLAFQIWLSFVSLALILGLWLFLFLRTDKQNKNVAIFSLDLTTLQNQFSENFVNYQNFILGGYKDVSFYTNDQQKDIDTYLTILNTNYTQLKQLGEQSESLHINIEQNVNSILINHYKLQILADSTRKAVRYRGFKDYGLEGKIRNAAHQIENLKTITKGEILQLRRHEKDFMLRGDSNYQFKFNQLIHNIYENHKLDSLTRFLLNNYTSTFNQYVLKSRELGYYNEGGLIHQIKQLHDQINASLSNIKVKTARQMMALNKANSNYLIIQTIFIGIIAILVSMFLVKTLTHDIKLLNENFRFYINSDFLNNPDKELPKPRFKLSSIEIRKLFANFQLLKETLNKTLVNLNKEKEKSEQSAHYKARFLANMSHEIRTPLNGIIGMLQIIEIDPLNNEQKQNLQLAKYSANHLLDLVNMILDYSKLSEDKMVVETRTFNLAMVIENIKGIFKHQVKDKNIKLNIKYDNNLPKQVKGDVLRIQQVLLNIISNAIKFTHKGNVTLKVNEIENTTKQIKIGFTITDTGIGIAENEQQKLFEAFVQSDISTTRKYGGTGLGLTISNQLVQLMGGSLLLKSKLNEGSQFYFELWFDKVNQMEYNGTTTITPANQLKGNKVLLAEDNKINRIVLERMLKKINLDCVLVENGKEALDTYLAEDFDMILMDIHMPVMNGIEATQHIQASGKFKSTPLPIIAITASAFEEDRKIALEHGLNDFITKPVLFDNLKIVLQKYLGAKVY